MKKLLNFSRRYKLFGVALVTLIVGLVFELTHQVKAAQLVIAVISIAEVLALAWGMWQDVRSGQYGINVLAVATIVASVLLKQYWAALVVVLILTGGECLEDFAKHRARSELDNLLENAPQTATVIKKGKPLEVKVSQVRAGDKIIIEPGDLVPVDAVVLEGSANFDELLLTGEDLPRSRQVGDKLLSGSINLDGTITAKATAAAEDSQYQQIIRLMRGAAAAQAPFARLTDRYSLPFTFLCFGIAVGVWVLSGHAIRFLEVIVVATPCPLLLAAPIALTSGMSRASRYGVIVKTGTAMERLAAAKTIAFGKTGTLTYGRLKVDKVKAFNGYDETQVLQLAAGLEQASNHVVAKAIVAAASHQKLKLIKVKSVRESAGLGVEAAFKGQQILVGRAGFLEAANVKITNAAKIAKTGQSLAYVAADDKLIGVIIFKDEPRQEAGAALSGLASLGIKNIAMITGDNLQTAKQISASLKIDNLHAEMLPADKIHTIEKYRPRPLVFVGDGVHDAPTLMAADVGIALGARGSTAAGEFADIVILRNDLGQVAAATSIAKQTFKLARQSILAGLGLSVALMAVFATGKFSALEGAILQAVVYVFVVFNALRAHLIEPNN